MEGELLDNDHRPDDHHPAPNCPLRDNHLIGDDSSNQCGIQNQLRNGSNPECLVHFVTIVLI